MRALLALSLGFVVIACSRPVALEPDELPLVVDKSCPGDPACADSGDGRLLAGYGVRDITPALEPFDDQNKNGRRDANEPYTDANKNGRYDDFWLFNSGKAATGVHDPIWVRCYALRQNQTTVAHCALDVGGYMFSEVKQLREQLDPALAVDLLITSATHDHSAPDTVGIFGPDETTSGYRPDWMKQVRDLLAAAVTDAVKGLRPARLSLGAIAVEDAGHDMRRYIDDTRDPVIIDNLLHVLQLDGEDGKPIVTVVNWTAHPDSMSRSNHLVSSEFPHYLRLEVERHTGAPVVYVSGSVGGQIGAGRVRPIADDGTELPCGERSFRFIEAWGRSIGRFANRAFDARTTAVAPKLAFRTARLNAHVENVAYQTAFALKLLPRQLFGFDPKRPIVRDEKGDNTPLVDSEVAYLRLGPAAMATIPGELLPELFLGGYDASRTGGWEPFIHRGPIVETCDATKQRNEGDYPDPADVTKAPKPPYLFDLMGGEPAHRMIFGLSQDMLGYIVPAYNFYLDPVAPYLIEPPGDSHYEEIQSLGPRAAPEIVGTVRQLVRSLEKQ